MPDCSTVMTLMMPPEAPVVRFPLCGGVCVWAVPGYGPSDALFVHPRRSAALAPEKSGSELTAPATSSSVGSV